MRASQEIEKRVTFGLAGTDRARIGGGGVESAGVESETSEQGRVPVPPVPSSPPNLAGKAEGAGWPDTAKAQK